MCICVFTYIVLKVNLVLLYVISKVVQEIDLNVESKYCYKGVGILPLLANFNCSCLTNWEFRCQASLTKIFLHNNK